MNKTKKNHVSGFTLVEMMIVVVILLIFGAVAATSCNSCTAPSIKANAEKYAAAYCRRFKNWQTPVVDCMGVDSDRNGYVTCTVSERAGTVTSQIECVGNVFFEYNTGCREYRLQNVVIQPGQGAPQ